MKVIIMQGIPGAGKSTWVKKNLPGATVCSADNYFIQPDGSYKFDQSKIAEAHKACLQTFLNLMVMSMRARQGYWLYRDTNELSIVVDNTNSTLWEMYPYIAVAAASGNEVEVVRIEVFPSVAAARNVHGVPESVVNRMADRLELPLPFWPCTFRLIVGE